MRHFLFALLLAAPFAAANGSALRVEQPANGATLAGGSTAIVRWSGSVAAGQDIEEWEAFLSVDGGHYYSARITPHLDVAVHEFRWIVPNVASRDVRILLRFGNERDEHAIEVPLSLRIEPSLTPNRQVATAATLGESARPGDPGVTQWANGDRSGAHVAVMTSSVPAMTARAHAAGHDIDVAAHSNVFTSIGIAMEAVRQIDRPRVSQHAAPRIAANILLRCCRLNV